MEQATFRPAVNTETEDRVSKLLLTISQYIFITVCGLSPLLFLPVAFMPLGYSKVLLLMIGITFSLIFYGLSVLRSGTFSFSLSPGLFAFWGVVAAATTSALLSGDVSDSLSGDAFGIHTVAFLAVMGVTMSLTGIMKNSKVGIMRLYMFFIGSAVVLCLFHVSRLLFGADFATLGFFSTNVSTPLGGWNDLAIFFGLTLLLGLVAVEQLPLTKIGKILLSVVSACSLVMLAVINFFIVWVVLAVVSLIVLIYSLTKNQFKGGQIKMDGEDTQSVASILLALAVFVFALTFMVGGSSIGTVISNTTGINYVEVRPSTSATFDIARNVFKESPVLGVGPNKFVDAWRLHKDPAINQTIFWSVDFESGNGYITTSFIQMGALGILTWIVFFGAVLYSGFRMLYRSQRGDHFWYFIGTSSFVATLYFWGMLVMYVPTVSILILAAVCTGIFFTAYSVLVPVRTFTLSIAANRNIGFVLVAGVMLIIVGSASSLYFTSQHYLATHQFNVAISTVQPGDTLLDLENSIARAYAGTQNDTFARQFAVYQLAQMNSLLGVQEPTEVEQQAFAAAGGKAVQSIQEAITTDRSNALNWQVSGQIYSVLASAGIEGAADRAKDAYSKAQELDPKNPVIVLLLSQLAAQTGDIATARSMAELAVEMRPAYTEALFFLTQFDISEGNVESAIVHTRAIIQLEPQNPARRYQLGVLHSSEGNIDGAILAFEQAVALDANYANARYFLAIGYAEAGRVEDAITQLRAVETLNPENEQVKVLISQLETNGVITQASTPAPIGEQNVVNEEGAQNVTTEDLNTNLISSDNSIPVEIEEEDAEEESETVEIISDDTAAEEVEVTEEPETDDGV